MSHSAIPRRYREGFPDVVDVSVTRFGTLKAVQVVLSDRNNQPLPRRHYTSFNAENLWEDLVHISHKRLDGLPDVLGMKLVSVDTGGFQSEWSFMEEKS